MKLDLSQLTVHFPQKPTAIWHDRQKRKEWHDYKVTGAIKGYFVGHIKISLQVQNEEPDTFWYNCGKTPPVPRPVVVYHATRREARGNGLSGYLITRANEIAKERFGEPLASDTHFCSNPNCNYKALGYHQHPAQRVWEKLEREGKAYRRDYTHEHVENAQPFLRWVMF